MKERLGSNNNSDLMRFHEDPIGGWGECRVLDVTL